MRTYFKPLSVSFRYIDSEEVRHILADDLVHLEVGFFAHHLYGVD